MRQNSLRNRKALVVSLVAITLFITSQVWARNPDPMRVEILPVQGQPPDASVQLEAFLSESALIGTVIVSEKGGQPWTGVEGQAHLLASTGQRSADFTLQPIGSGEFRFVVPIGQLEGSEYLEVRLSGHGQSSECRAVYQIDPQRGTATWVDSVREAKAPLSPQTSGGPDEFGYTWNDATTYAWIDTSGGTSISLRDDDWTGPFYIGFPFTFYGQDYTQFYVDSNGYIGFDDTQTTSHYANTRLPHAARPSNLIAPFWDDFDPSQGGTVRYRTFGSAPNQYLAVEWNQVPLYDSPSDAQTFQVILYESSNDIKFQYPDTREGDYGDRSSATVGIENGDGTIGLEHLYLIPIDVNYAILIDYNQATYNAFVTPDRQGSPAAKGEAASFRLRVRNLGSISDSFYLSRSGYDGSNWSVSFYQANGTTPANNTGPINPGEEKEMVAKVQVPSYASLGDWTRATIRAQSQHNPSEYHEVTLDTTAGTSFAQVYTDNESGDETEDSENYFDSLQNGERASKRVTTDEYEASWVSVATTPNGNAVNLWNIEYYNGAAFVSEINYAILSPSGGFVLPVTRLTDNSEATENTFDFSPTADVAPNGNVAIGWERQPGTYNVWCSIVDSGGGTVKPPAALTNNAGDYPRDYPPSVGALTGGRFVLAWEHAAASGGPLDIYYAVLNNNGTISRPATRLTDGTGLNETPRVTALPDGQAAIAWTVYNDDGYPEIAYAIVNSSGAVTHEPTQITSNGNSGALSGYADIAALSDGRLAVAWTQQTGGDQQIQYTIITGSEPPPTETPTATPTNTPTPTSTPTPTEEPAGITNGDFEDGSTGWVEYSTHGWDLIVTDLPADVTPHSGTWAVWLGGDLDDTSYIQQQVTVPPSRPYLKYWHWIASEDSCGWDIGGVVIDGSVVDAYNLCETENTGGWTQNVVDLTAYAGQSVSLQLRVETDSSLNSNLFVDDVAFQANSMSAQDHSSLDNFCPGNALPKPDNSLSGNDYSPKYTLGVSNVLRDRDKTRVTSPSKQDWDALDLAPTEGELSEPTRSSEASSLTGATDVYTVPNDLSSANIYVSLATDEDDNLIMTWLDNANAQYLFYALANSSGSIRTPATIFQRTRRSYLWSSWNGYGNDALRPAGPTGPYAVYLPLVLRGYPPYEPEPTPTATATPVPITNGGFETGTFSGWVRQGDPSGLIPQVVTSRRNSGSYAAVIGQENAPCRTGQGGLAGRSWIQQSIWVPTSGSPQLSLYYRILSYDKFNASKYDRFEVYINGTLLHRSGNTNPRNWGEGRCDHSVDDLGWQQLTYDLGAYRGRIVQLKLVNITHPDDWYGTWTYIDDVEVK
jgi:hypothetical protein